MATVKVQLLVPAAIPTEDGKKVDLKVGVHDIDEKVLSHWFMRGLITSGKLILVKDKPLPVPPNPTSKLADNMRVFAGRGIPPIPVVTETTPKPVMNPKVEEILKTVNTPKVEPITPQVESKVDAIDSVEVKTSNEKVEVKVEEVTVKPSTKKRRKA
jgi:hypothetical protein